MNFMIYLTDFVLGLFVGTLALASFSPKNIAREVYRSAWFVGGLFVVLAYLNKEMEPKSLLQHSAPSTNVLIIIVLLGIIVAGVLGGVMVKRWSEYVESKV